MKFVIAPDSFKGGMTAKQAADAIQTGLNKIFPEAIFEKNSYGRRWRRYRPIIGRCN